MRENWNAIWWDVDYIKYFIYQNAMQYVSYTSYNKITKHFLIWILFVSLLCKIEIYHLDIVLQNFSHRKVDIELI